MDNYNRHERQIILKVTDDAIKFGLEKHQILLLKIEDYPKKLRLFGASFVTLEINKQLRGCIGTLEAYQPLIQDVAQNAYAAAFRDPRFSPLTSEEYSKITKHISVLSKPSPISFKSEEDLLEQIRLGIDGLILTDQGGHRSTFLPAIWESLPKPKLFLQHLKLKAELSPEYWSTTLTIERYTVEVIE
ncbi:MAG: AmmeMemoRadiSam system protein A [Coxiellaceae bacterium]|jgi:AmmeMemoRadiSam system protein A|nr:AmmeMemoRadiSam system protein A [Coxiellaceae bacterium]